MTKEKFFGGMGWAGMVTSILMYVFYFPQILNNLDGHKGTFIQPFMAGNKLYAVGFATVSSRKNATGLSSLPTFRALFSASLQRLRHCNARQDSGFCMTGNQS